jgi:hypothetical protein
VKHYLAELFTFPSVKLTGISSKNISKELRMTSAKTIGRTFGILLLLQIVIGSTVNFGLLGAAITGPPGFLINAAANPTRMSIAALLMLLGGFLSIALSTTAWPVFRRYSPRAALAYVAISGAGLAVAAVESAAIMSMLSLSQEYAKAAPEAGQFELVGTVVRYARYWAHYTHLLVGSGMLCLVYTTFFRFGIVPRLLAGIGLASILLQMTGLAMPFFGYRINFYLLAPMGLCHIALSIWLVVKGFHGPDHITGVEEIKD